MIARMIVCLVALSLSSTTLIYSTGRPPSRIQQPQSARPSQALRIFIEEDFSKAQILKRELTEWFVRIGKPIIFVEKDVEPYDLRILLASGAGSDSGSCRPAFSESLSTCSVSITIYFVSAMGLTPDGKIQFTETGVGRWQGGEITTLARKLAKRLSVLPNAKPFSVK